MSFIKKGPWLTQDDLSLVRVLALEALKGFQMDFEQMKAPKGIPVLEQCLGKHIQCTSLDAHVEQCTPWLLPALIFHILHSAIAAFCNYCTLQLLHFACSQPALFAFPFCMIPARTVCIHILTVPLFAA